MTDRTLPERDASTRDLDDAALVGVLTDWLPRQRWYAGKGRPVAGHVVESGAVLTDAGDARLRHVVVRVDYDSGAPEH